MTASPIRRVWQTLQKPLVGVPLAAVGVSMPLIVAAVFLAGRRWHPALDMAMIDFRVRDVFGAHTPLVGLPGRLGTPPDVGSHPGPLAFYLLAPVYRLSGMSPWSLQLGSVVVNSAAVSVAILLGWRRAAWAGVVAVAALAAVSIHAYGQLALTHPWNPYVPLMPWVLVVVSGWGVACKDRRALLPLVVAASLCAQSHISYVGVAAGGCVVGLAHAMRFARRDTLIAAAVGVVLWLPPLVDQLINDPGNVSIVVDHFRHSSEPAVGFANGIELAIRQLDPWPLVLGAIPDGTGPDSSLWRGIGTLACFAAAALAGRSAPLAVRRLQLVVVVALGLGVFSIARIVGPVHVYLALWEWPVSACVLGSSAIVAGHAALGVARRRNSGIAARIRRRNVLGAGVVAVALVTGGTTVEFARARVFEPLVSGAVANLLPGTEAAIERAAAPMYGRDTPLVVRSFDAISIGGVAFSLVDELAGNGVDVRFDKAYRVLAGDHRVVEGSADDHVGLVVATGGWVSAWRGVETVVEVAAYDSRTAAQREEADRLTRSIGTRLKLAGDDGVLVRLLEENIFAFLLHPDLAPEVRSDAQTLYDLGNEFAVFLAPPGTDAPRFDER